MPKEWELGQSLFLPLSLSLQAADKASCWCETSPLPSAVEQAALQLSQPQKWQWTQTKLSLPRSLGHLAFGWELTHQPTCLLIFRAAVVRRWVSHLAWPIFNRGQMNGFQGQSRKHLRMVIAGHTIYASHPEEWFPCVCGFRSLKPLCNNRKKSRVNHSPVTCIFNDALQIIFTCPPAQGVRADGTDSVPC